MKLFNLALTAALVAASHLSAVSPPPIAAPALAPSADTAVIEFGAGPRPASLFQTDTQVAFALPNCGSYQGSTCATTGASFRCQWAPYEPGRCFCNTSHVWQCG